MTTPHLIRRSCVLLLAGAGLLVACGDGEGAADTTPETAEVTIERSRFAPDEVRVAAGATVVFRNLDPFAHTVTAVGPEPGFDSGALGQDAEFERRFDQPGTYRYFCEIHPTMRAVVVAE